ncbi:DUF302 domain-containing protein [Seohaeicola saemankumensis]|nr:DUF302 domain-containing protein [Seohaeicola saemankumensis]MCA0872462.1 DUF302 domain-containing protein [Seohaeicola saemankumensis]
MKSRIPAAVFALLASHAGAGADMAPRKGWVVAATDKSFASLVEATVAATKASGLFVVTQAGPTQAAARRGITIPGNRVIGVFNNDYAVRVLDLSTAAMIEAPIRLYVTENVDETATLSYKLPSHLFAPYLDEGGDGLRDIARDLDGKLSQISTLATQ